MINPLKLQYGNIVRKGDSQMKICISAISGSLDAPVEPRFGRSPYFLIVDSESMDFETISNLASNAVGGAGIQAAQTVASKGARVLITGSVGPNAFQALSSAGIRVVTGGSGTVREAVERYKKGELAETMGPTVSGHFGMGGRFGRP
jgi:predicted Fe-Mo cluster-binding NifX family protein